jgi:hypothetical protein
LHVIRLILGGVRHRYPNLQIVIGHIGEVLPLMFQRLDVMPMAMTRLRPRVSTRTSRQKAIRSFRAKATRVAMVQQRSHLDHRLLRVAPRTIGVPAPDIDAVRPLAEKGTDSDFACQLSGPHPLRR